MHSIIRLDKCDDLQDAVNHNKRFVIQDNITQEQSHLNHSWGPKNFSDIKDALEKRTAEVAAKADQTIRKDARTFLEVYFGASPEYFYDDLRNDEDLRARWDSLRNSVPEEREIINRVKKSLNVERLQQWLNLTKEYMREEFGKNIITWDLHLDEKTPHIQAITAVEINGRISCKEFFTPKRCRNFQTSYAEKLKRTGLKRGVENSEKTHSEIKAFNNSTNNLANQILTIKEEEKPQVLTSKNYWLNKKKSKLGIYTEKEVNKIIDDVAKSWQTKAVAKNKVIDEQNKVIQKYKDQFKNALQNEIEVKQLKKINSQQKVEIKNYKKKLHELHKVKNNNVLDTVFKNKPLKP